MILIELINKELNQLLKKKNICLTTEKKEKALIVLQRNKFIDEKQINILIELISKEKHSLNCLTKK